MIRFDLVRFPVIDLALGRAPVQIWSNLLLLWRYVVLGEIKRPIIRIKKSRCEKDVVE